MNVRVENAHGDWIVWRPGMGRSVEIFDLCVRSERRKGRGSELVAEMLRRLDAEGSDAAMVFAVTRASNEIAHQFYESMGFHILGRLHRFYRDKGGKGETALVWGLER